VKPNEKYKNDIAFLMSRRHSNGGDLWATKDNNIGKGSPFSTKEVALMLVELGFKKSHSIVKDIAELILMNQQEDGRFRIWDTGAIYPCHTIGCLRVLCYLGYSKDKRLAKTFEHLLEIQQEDGGWVCNKFSFGRGPDTRHSNPGPTLEALDAFRFMRSIRLKRQMDKAVKFLLWHWDVKKPVGPCQYGMGTLFNQTEFPFFRYNLFYYTYTLSFYKSATRDKRFKEAFSKLRSKLQNGKMLVENPNRALVNMDMCKKGNTSSMATRRFKEIEKNIKGDNLL
jgi:hypothetical protein